MSAAPNSTRIQWSDLELLLTPQTFAPRQSSIGLLDFARSLPLWLSPLRPQVLVDMCCGCGALGLALFLSEPQAFRSLLLLDASAAAVGAAEANRVRYQVPGRTIRWQAGAPLAVTEPALIICNPPFLPVEQGHDLPEWERRCVTADEGGFAVVRECFRSIAGTAHHLILKSLPTQLPLIAACEGLTHRLAAQRVADVPEVVFSYWEPSGPASQ